jgi:glycosyltransferase involved in cell wall biosynthesis
MVTARDVERGDAILFCRNVRSDRIGPLRAAVRRRVPVIYDLDDNFFELPPDSDAGRSHAQPEQLAALAEYLSSASLVRVYSRPLLERARELNENVELMTSAVDLGQIRTPPAPAAGLIKIVYATSRLDDKLAAIFLPALRRLLDEAGSRVEVTFWGPRPPAELRGARHHALIHNYDRFLRAFSSSGYDIGLAPLADDVFHRSKTNTKFREYGAARIAGVYSDVEVYSHCVRNGETGLLVANTAADWYRAMRRLVEDAPLRARVQEQARTVVEAHYSQTQFEEVLLEQIRRLVDTDASPRKISFDAAHAGPPPSSRGRRLASRAIEHVRRNGIARGWNTLRWLGSSGWSLARLQWRLRR